MEVNRGVSRAAGLFGLFGLLLLLELLWIRMGAAGFTSARPWAELHPAQSQPPLAIGAVLVMGEAWALSRGYRWAWLVAVVWAGIYAVAGAIAATVLVLTHSTAVIQYASQHTVETAGGIVSFGCLLGSLYILVQPEARRYFHVGGSHRVTRGAA